MEISNLAEKMFSALTSQQDTRTSLSSTMLSSAITLLQNEKYTQSVQAFRAAIAYDPQSTDAYNYLATAYLKLGKNKEAIEAYKTSLAVDSTQAETHVNLANIYMEQNQNTEAEKEYKAAISADPSEELASYSYGLFLLKNDRAAEAATQFKNAARLSPNDGNIFYGLGTAYNKLGQYNDAVTQLEKATSLRKEFYDAHYELGNAYVGLGDTDKVQQQINILKDADTAETDVDAEALEEAIRQPKMTGVVSSGTTLSTVFMGATPLYLLDTELAAPSSSKDFTIQFQFDSDMDVASVMNITNWSITKATGGVAGTYNNGVYLADQNDVTLSPIPKSVMYDATTQRATITFTLSQNAEGDATIDPAHLVFKFMGKDDTGKVLDSSADEYDGFAGETF